MLAHPHGRVTVRGYRPPRSPSPTSSTAACLLARLPKGVIGEDGTRLVGSLLLAGLWQATTARARIPETTAPTR
ncbi:hypothetical protein [Salinispora arenicola]|uniref:hypothetical protein n=1 Tax=Salinispora arenicola TaxID=168697 RepID=UPI0027DBE2D5|nr:hypothetical protein [Salinispora arenicola]